MTDRAELRERIERQIARNTFTAAAEAVLAEIETTHIIARPADITVLALGDLIVRSVDETTERGSMRKFAVGSAVIDGLRALGIGLVEIESARAAMPHIAAESDTPKGTP